MCKLYRSRRAHAYTLGFDVHPITRSRPCPRGKDFVHDGCAAALVLLADAFVVGAAVVGGESLGGARTQQEVSSSGKGGGSRAAGDGGSVEVLEPEEAIVRGLAEHLGLVELVVDLAQLDNVLLELAQLGRVGPELPRRSFGQRLVRGRLD